jgi:hypothetical protein
VEPAIRIAILNNVESVTFAIALQRTSCLPATRVAAALFEEHVARAKALAVRASS